MFKKITNLLNFNLNHENKNLLFFTCGISISLFGSAIFSFTMGLYILRITGSALSFATNLLLFTLPVIFIFPVAGVITDRIERKKIIICSDFLSFLFLLIVFIISYYSELSISLIYVSTFILTILASFNNISLEEAKPEIVSNDKLITINSISKMASSSSNILGPMLGGIIYAFADIKIFIIVNSLSFLLAAIIESFINYNYNTNSDTPDYKKNIISNKNFLNSWKATLKNIWYDMIDGYKYIYNQRVMKGFLYIFIALNFFTTFSFTVPVPYLMNTIWKIKAEYFGIIEGGFPVGMLLGAILVKIIMGKIRYNNLLKIIIPIMILETVLFSLPLFIWNIKPAEIFILIYYSFLMLIMGLLISLVDIPIMIILQQKVPGDLLGRVISVTISIVKIIVPVTLLLSGALINIISPVYLFLSGGGIMLIFSLSFFPSSSGHSLSTIDKSPGT